MKEFVESKSILADADHWVVGVSFVDGEKWVWRMISVVEWCWN